MTQLDLLEDFALLLFIHLARVDGSMHPNERDVILVRMGELFPHEPSWTDRLAEMEKVYGSIGQSNAEALLREQLPKFQNADSAVKGIIHIALYDIINANGRVSEEEIETLQLFKGWLTSR